MSVECLVTLIGSALFEWDECKRVNLVCVVFVVIVVNVVHPLVFWTNKGFEREREGLFTYKKNILKKKEQLTNYSSLLFFALCSFESRATG